MKSPHKIPMLLALAITLALAALTGSAHANVYATNIKVDGSTNSPTISPGTNISLGYILNEPASAGVTIQIFAGSTVVRSMAVAAGNPGTLRGTNTVTWDGRNNAGNPVAGGDYSFSITAAATGYPVWTQTTSDTNSGNQVLHASGIAVNQNTNSFYYGRVFVANSPYPPLGDPLDPLGFYKLNADGSPAEEGMLSDGGYTGWTGFANQSPFRVKVGEDDRFYALDLAGNGVVMSWDQQITTNSILYVMRDDNNPGAFLSGFTVTGNGTNRQLWMVDDYSPGLTFGGHGLLRWDIQADGTLAAGDLGTNIIPVGTGSDLDESAFDVAIDQNGKMYLACWPSFDTQYKIMRFPAYTGTLVTNTDWRADNTSPFDNNYAIAVNPAATCAAVALNDFNALLILNANSGATITNISVANPAHAVAWDNVGNAYVGFGADESESLWQAWSPPGPNQATTTGLEIIHVLAPPSPPQITSISRSGDNVTIHFTGPASDAALAYLLLSSSVVPKLNTSFTTNTGAIITGSGGVYQATLTNNATAQFYRVQRQ
jgi:hypothetical protein